MYSLTPLTIKKYIQMSYLKPATKYRYVKTIFILLTAIFVSSVEIQAAFVAPSAESETCDSCGVESNTRTITGILETISYKARMLQIRKGNDTKILNYNEDTILLGVDTIRELSTKSAWTFEYREDRGMLLAISIEPPQRDPSLSQNQIDAATLSSLLSDTQDVVGYTLIDSRPAAAYENGHIEGAISIYDGEFDNSLAKLPHDKEQLIVFYCDGSA